MGAHEEKGLAGSAVAGKTGHAPLGPLDADRAASMHSAAKAVSLVQKHRTRTSVPPSGEYHKAALVYILEVGALASRHFVLSSIELDGFDDG